MFRWHLATKYRDIPLSEKYYRHPFVATFIEITPPNTDILCHAQHFHNLAMSTTFKLWPNKSSQQCPLIGWVLVPSCNEISPLITKIWRHTKKNSRTRCDVENFKQLQPQPLVRSLVPSFDEVPSLSVMRNMCHRKTHGRTARRHTRIHKPFAVYWRRWKATR